MSQERIQHIINNLSEGLSVEVKNWLGGLSTKDEKAKLAKEIIALCNNGGGHIFIGFEDKGEGHPEIEPMDGQVEAFTQDSLSSVIQQYVEPPCQCEVGFFSREGSGIRHPVITVPGGHRTPVWAAKSSPDQKTLTTKTVYVRRPGGASEGARNQDDWEKLLERLVRARQGEQLDAIREILNPTNEIAPSTEGLKEWVDESLDLWSRKTDPLQEKDARKLKTGYWYFAFEIEDFPEPSLRDLNEYLEREVRRYSGWPPFTYIHRDPLRPVAQGNVIQAWLAKDHNPDSLIEDGDHADFWRVSRGGKGFLLRPMQDDRDSYLSNRAPRPEGRFFDWTLPIYRSVELLKFVQGLAEKFADTNARYRVILRYEGTSGRKLEQHSFKYNLWSDAHCYVQSIEASHEGSIREIENNLEETIFKLLAPVFEQFEFTELPVALINNVTKEALTN